MSEEQAEWAIQSLYENPGVRDELPDAEAEILLQWAEEQVMRLANMDLDDVSFEAAYDNLSGMIRRMNKLAGRQPYLSLEDVEVALNRIAEHATVLGLPIPPDNLTAYLHQPSSQSSQPNVQALIDLVNSGQAPTT